MPFLEENNPNCIIVGARKVFEEQDASSVSSSLEELSLLADTLGLRVMGSIVVSLRKITPSIFYGKGQIESISNKASAMDCPYIIFNDDITPAQFKNIKKIILKREVFDRTGIILEIFRNNAKTKESKLQVELASLQYMLPRLTRQWTHLERQMGGTGTRGGPGEKQIEIDRRLIGKKITKLKSDLEKITKNREVQSYSRKNVFRVSLVGYTNAGKSSLLNALCQPETTYVEDKLFATLDTTTRNINISKNKRILVTDTVGFIKDLPHDLVASFRSTFEEAKSSDLVIIVVDSSISRKIIQEHISVIQSTLDGMSIKNKETLFVFNKVDQIEDKEKIAYLKKKYKDSILVSAREHIMIDDLVKYIESLMKRSYVSGLLAIPHKESSLLKDIYGKFEIESRKDTFEHIELKISGNALDIEKIRDKLKKV